MGFSSAENASPHELVTRSGAFAAFANAESKDRYLHLPSDAMRIGVGHCLSAAGASRPLVGLEGSRCGNLDRRGRAAPVTLSNSIKIEPWLCFAALAPPWK